MLVNTLTMLREMMNVERFEAIEAAFKDLDGVSDVVQMIQIKEIPELFR